MTLPKVHAPIETVEVSGEMFTIRVLTRLEAATFHKMGADGAPLAELETYVIAAATDTPTEEARTWYAASPSYVVNELISHIDRTSKLSEEAQKSGAERDSSG